MKHVFISLFSLNSLFAAAQKVDRTKQYDQAAALVTALYVLAQQRDGLAGIGSRSEVESDGQSWDQRKTAGLVTIRQWAAGLRGNRDEVQRRIAAARLYVAAQTVRDLSTARSEDLSANVAGAGRYADFAEAPLEHQVFEIILRHAGEFDFIDYVRPQGQHDTVIEIYHGRQSPDFSDAGKATVSSTYRYIGPETLDKKTVWRHYNREHISFNVPATIGIDDDRRPSYKITASKTGFSFELFNGKGPAVARGSFEVDGNSQQILRRFIAEHSASTPKACEPKSGKKNDPLMRAQREVIQAAQQLLPLIKSLTSSRATTLSGGLRALQRL